MSDWFSIVPPEAIQDHRLGLIETRVLVALFSFRGKNTNTIWPSRAKIAERSGYSENAVSRALSKLVAKGWLERKQHRGPNTFRVTVPEVADIATFSSPEMCDFSLTKVADPDTLSPTKVADPEQTVADPETVSNSDINSCRLGTDTVADPATPEHTKNIPENRKEKVNQKENSKRFVPPTVREVQDYLDEKGYTGVDAEKFVDHYEATGWMRGKTKIKSWKACVRTWRGNGKDKEPSEYKKKIAEYTLGAI